MHVSRSNLLLHTVYSPLPPCPKPLAGFKSNFLFAELLLVCFTNIRGFLWPLLSFIYLFF